MATRFLIRGPSLCCLTELWTSNVECHTQAPDLPVGGCRVPKNSNLVRDVGGIASEKRFPDEGMAGTDHRRRGESVKKISFAGGFVEGCLAGRVRSMVGSRPDLCPPRKGASKNGGGETSARRKLTGLRVGGKQDGVPGTMTTAG